MSLRIGKPEGGFDVRATNGTDAQPRVAPLGSEGNNNKEAGR